MKLCVVHGFLAFSIALSDRPYPSADHRFFGVLPASKDRMSEVPFRRAFEGAYMARPRMPWEQELVIRLSYLGSNSKHLPLPCDKYPAMAQRNKDLGRCIDINKSSRGCLPRRFDAANSLTARLLVSRIRHILLHIGDGRFGSFAVFAVLVRCTLLQFESCYLDSFHGATTPSLTDERRRSHGPSTLKQEPLCPIPISGRPMGV